MTQQIASPVPPNLRALLDAFKQELMLGINCASVGNIVSFDAAKQTATVKLAIARMVNGVPVTYPLLTDCPVFVPSGGGASLTFPVAAGDSCLVLFNDADLDNWFVAGSPVINSARRHDLSDGLVLVGFRNRTNPIADYSTTDPQLRQAGGIVGIGENGKVDIRNSTGSLLSALDTLCSGLDSLCGALTGWVDTHSDVPNAATIAAINAAKAILDSAKTKIDDLLK